MITRQNEQGNKISGRCGEVVVRGGSTVNRTVFVKEIERNICV